MNVRRLTIRKVVRRYGLFAKIPVKLFGQFNGYEIVGMPHFEKDKIPQITAKAPNYMPFPIETRVFLEGDPS